MTFLNNSFLWLLPLASIPIILHFINKRTPKKVVFSYIKLIKMADQSLMPKKKLRDLLLMILRTLLILFLILFFSRPVLQKASLFNQKGEQATVVILMDISASMGLIKGGREAASVAIDQVQTLLRKFSKDVRVGLVAYSSQVEKEVAPTKERSRVSTAMNGLSTKPRPTDVKPALESAFQMLANQPAGRQSILIVSDQSKNGWDSLIQREGEFNGYDPEVRVIAWEVIGKNQNKGISEAALQLSEEGVLKGQWQPHVAGLKQDQTWSLKLNERIVGQGQIPPNRESDSSIPLQAQLPEGGFYSGQIEVSPDALPFDDIYFLAGRVPKGFRLLIVDGESGLAPADSEAYYLKLALESPRDPRLESIQVIRPEVLNQEKLANYDAIILANTRDLESEAPALIEWVEAGGGLLMTAGGNWPKDPQVPLNVFRTKSLEQTKGIKVDKPVEKPFFLANVTGIDRFEWKQIDVQKYKKLALDSSTEVLLKLTNGDPLLVKKQLGKGYVLCLTSTLDRNWTNLPAKPLFAPLVREMTAALADPLREQTSLNGFVDEPFRVRLPSGVKNVTVVAPNGTSGGATVNKDGYLEWQAPSEPGLYRVKTNQKNKDFKFAINIRDVKKEGDLSRIPEGELKRIFPESSVNLVSYGKETTGSVLAALQGKDLTQFFIILVFILLALETFFGWPRKQRGRA